MEVLSIQTKEQQEKRTLTIEQVVKKINEEKLFIVGVCGIPGAGKSTISEKIQQSIPNSVIVPMDGFHLYRKELDEEGKRRRGAPFTFNLAKFKQKVLQLKNPSKYPISFPSFDHSLKDPVEDDIKVEQSANCVIIEGLYIFDKSMELDGQQFWDLKIFINEGRETCLPRVIQRCVAKGIEDTREKAVQRAVNSDMVNGDYVLANTCFDDVWYVSNPQWGNK